MDEIPQESPSSRQTLYLSLATTIPVAVALALAALAVS